jgi:hypothetical protein
MNHINKLSLSKGGDRWAKIQIDHYSEYPDEAKSSRVSGTESQGFIEYRIG